MFLFGNCWIIVKAQNRIKCNPDAPHTQFAALFLTLSNQIKVNAVRGTVAATSATLVLCHSLCKLHWAQSTSRRVVRVGL